MKQRRFLWVSENSKCSRALRATSRRTMFFSLILFEKEPLSVFWPSSTRNLAHAPALGKLQHSSSRALSRFVARFKVSTTTFTKFLQIWTFASRRFSVKVHSRARKYYITEEGKKWEKFRVPCAYKDAFPVLYCVTFWIACFLQPLQYVRRVFGTCM